MIFWQIDEDLFKVNSNVNTYCTSFDFAQSVNAAVRFIRFSFPSEDEDPFLLDFAMLFT